MDQRTPRERARNLVDLLVPDWRPTASQVLWGIRIATGLIVLLSISSLISAQYGKTIWDSAQLLLTASIPVVIAIVGNRYTQQRAQNDTLQAFLDQMGELMLDSAQPLRGAPQQHCAYSRRCEVRDRASSGRPPSSLSQKLVDRRGV